MHVRELLVENWGPFRGEHRLRLGARAHGVVARSVDDPECSNWLGKTHLLEALRFAFDGWHRHRTEDGLISNGQAHGRVVVLLSTGEVLSRSRERGKPTKLSLHDGGRVLWKDEAQKKIHDLVGLSSEDFMTASFFEQKKLSQLVVARPEVRTQVVVSWLSLAPVERCAEIARAKLAASTDGTAEKEALLKVLRSQDGDQGALLKTHEAAKVSEKHARAKLSDAAADLEENGAREKARHVRVEFVRLSEELAKHVQAKAPADAKDRWREANETGEAMRAHMKRRDHFRGIAGGDFAGLCPVVSAPCPARAFIEENRERCRTEAERFQHAYEEAKAVHEKALAAHGRAQAQTQAAERQQAKGDALRGQIAGMLPAAEAARNVPEAGDAAALRRAHDEAYEQVRAATSAVAEAAVAVSRAAETRRRIAEIEKEIEVSRPFAEIMREAAVVFGRNGAQRKIAEDALAEIEEDANAGLAEAGIDLRVDVRWSREGQGLAHACDGCGMLFPSSRTAKVCTRCGAGRGPNIVAKLEFNRSHDSGGADDLAGAAVGLAAGGWLRGERGSPWGVVVLDEPFGSLDTSKRRAFARHLGALVLRGGVEQAFVVSHDPQTMHGLPGRIEIVSEGGWSRAEVVA